MKESLEDKLPFEASHEILIYSSEKEKYDEVIHSVFVKLCCKDGTPYGPAYTYKEWNFRLLDERPDWELTEYGWKFRGKDFLLETATSDFSPGVFQYMRNTREWIDLRNTLWVKHLEGNKYTISLQRKVTQWTNHMVDEILTQCGAVNTLFDNKWEEEEDNWYTTVVTLDV